MTCSVVQGGHPMRWDLSRERPKDSIGVSCVSECSLYRNMLEIHLMGHRMEILQKTKTRRTSVQSSSDAPGLLSEENKNTNSKRYLHSCVYCGIIHNSQDKQLKCKLEMNE